MRIFEEGETTRLPFSNSPTKNIFTKRDDRDEEEEQNVKARTHRYVTEHFANSDEISRSLSAAEKNIFTKRDERDEEEEQNVKARTHRYVTEHFANSDEISRSLSAVKIPNHVAIIMDGNGRWAKSKGKIRVFGHQKGAKVIRPVMEMAKDLGVSHLTLWAFSVDNWKRPDNEVTFLMKLLEKYIDDEKENFIKNKIRLRVIGNLDDLPKNVSKKVESTIKETSGFNKFNLNIALSYGGREDIAGAVQKIAQKLRTGALKEEEITDKVISAHLFTVGIPDPELIIRTGGEFRLSNFLIWQSAYSELFFSPVLWPDFRPSHFLEAINHYSNRERRFGGTKKSVQGFVNQEVTR